MMSPKTSHDAPQNLTPLFVLQSHKQQALTKTYSQKSSLFGDRYEFTDLARQARGSIVHF